MMGKSLGFDYSDTKILVTDLPTLCFWMILMVTPVAFLPNNPIIITGVRHIKPSSCSISLSCVYLLSLISSHHHIDYHYHDIYHDS